MYSGEFGFTSDRNLKLRSLTTHIDLLPFLTPFQNPGRASLLQLGTGGSAESYPSSEASDLEELGLHFIGHRSDFDSSSGPIFPLCSPDDDRVHGTIIRWPHKNVRTLKLLNTKVPLDFQTLCLIFPRLETLWLDFPTHVSLFSTGQIRCVLLESAFRGLRQHIEWEARRQDFLKNATNLRTVLFLNYCGFGKWGVYRDNLHVYSNGEGVVEDAGNHLSFVRMVEYGKGIAEELVTESLISGW